jgi:hypothetical protein
MGTVTRDQFGDQLILKYATAVETGSGQATPQA